MRLVSKAFVLLLAAGPIACANIPSSQDEPSPVVTVGCTNNLGGPNFVSLFDWELAVSTDDPIESGQAFIATLEGVAMVSESLLDLAQGPIPGGVSEVNLVDLNATVHEREGATGPDVVLEPDWAVPYQCFVGRAPCDPGNDLAGVPGVRGNTDCQPEGPGNPCGRFIRVPTSNDCTAGGTCSGLQKALQCDLHAFCITGGLRIPLKAVTQTYTADVEAEEVLFGWADESTGATIKQDDPNWGTWILPEADYKKGPGPVGLRLSFSGVLPVAFECAMGVDSTGPLGVDSAALLSSPTPSHALISLPIQKEVF